MFKFASFLLVLFFASTYAHSKKYVQELIDDANSQIYLTPQELNPAFRGASDSVKEQKLIQMLPIRPVLPHQIRLRRDLEEVTSLTNVSESREGSLTEQVKHYSRLVACFVLVVTAVIEVVVYVVEAYQTEA